MDGGEKQSLAGGVIDVVAKRSKACGMNKGKDEGENGVMRWVVKACATK
jgi:hypothetical protein